MKASCLPSDSLGSNAPWTNCHKPSCSDHWGFTARHKPGLCLVPGRCVQAWNLHQYIGHHKCFIQASHLPLSEFLLSLITDPELQNPQRSPQDPQVSNPPQNRTPPIPDPLHSAPPLRLRLRPPGATEGRARSTVRAAMEPLPSESKIRRIPSSSEVDSDTPSFRKADCGGRAAESEESVGRVGGGGGLVAEEARSAKERGELSPGPAMQKCKNPCVCALQV